MTLFRQVLCSVRSLSCSTLSKTPVVTRIHQIQRSQYTEKYDKSKSRYQCEWEELRSKHEEQCRLQVSLCNKFGEFRHALDYLEDLATKIRDKGQSSDNSWFASGINWRDDTDKLKNQQKKLTDICLDMMNYCELLIKNQEKIDSKMKDVRQAADLEFGELGNDRDDKESLHQRDRDQIMWLRDQVEQIGMWTYSAITKAHESGYYKGRTEELSQNKKEDKRELESYKANLHSAVIIKERLEREITEERNKRELQVDEKNKEIKKLQKKHEINLKQKHSEWETEKYEKQHWPKKFDKLFEENEKSKQENDKLKQENEKLTQEMKNLEDQWIPNWMRENLTVIITLFGGAFGLVAKGTLSSAKK